MDLSATVVNAVNTVISSGVIEDRIAKAVEKTITDAIAEQLRGYSDFGKAINDALAKSLRFDPVDLPAYNDLVVKLVRQQVKHQVEQSLALQVADHIEKLLEPPPAELKLSALVERFVRELREKNEEGCVCYGSSEARVDVRQDGDHTMFWKVALYESSDDKEPSIWMGINTGALERDQDAEMAGHIYHLRFRDQRVESQMFVENLDGIERMLFQMKAAGRQCRIILDDVSCVDLATENYHD